MSFQSAVYGFVPTSITGCALWLDGADPAGTGVVPANGATISTWSDKSGNGKNAAATGTPTYLSGGGINFNGSSYFLNQTFSQNLSQRSIFIVMQETVKNDYCGVLSLIPNPTSGNDYSTTTGLSIETTNGLRFYANTGGYFADMGNNSLLVKAVYNDNMNGTTGSGFLNGNTATSVTASYTAGTCSGYGIGARWLGSMSISYALNGVIYEILFFNSPLGTSDRRQVEGYLAQKWGLTSSLLAGHPGLTTTIYRSDYTKQNVMTALPYYAAFSPRQIPGCALWLDGADPAGTGVVPSQGSQIGSWIDKSGNGRTMSVQGTAANITYSRVNGINAVWFNNPSVNNAYMRNMSFQVLTTASVFMVFVPLSFSATWSFLWSWNPTASQYLLPGARIQQNNNNLQLYLTWYGSGNYGTVTNGTTYLSYFDWTNTTSMPINWSLNGTVPPTSSTVGSMINNTSVTEFDLGADLGGTYGNMYLSEMIVYNSILSSTQRQQVESYLAQKWGLTASLPGGHSHATQPAGAITLQSLVNKQIMRKRIVYTINWTYSSIPSQANLILQVNSRNWTSSSSILDSITGVAWNMTNASLNSSRNTILMSGNGLFKYNNAGAGPSGFSGTQHTVMMVYYRLANATSASKGNPPSVTLNLTGYLYTINRTPATITNQLLAGENSSWVYQSAYQVGTNQTVLDGTTGWTFIAFVYTGTALNVYLNGQPENNTNSVSNPATTTLTNNYFSIFGNPRDNNAFINGELAFYGLWNTQLTAQNILDFYNANKDQFLAFP